MRSTLNGLSEAEQMLFLERLMRAIKRHSIYETYCRETHKEDQRRAESREIMAKYGATPTPEPGDEDDGTDTGHDGGLA